VPRPRATYAIVFRRGFQVMRRDQEPEQFRLLEALVAGRPLAAAVRASIGRRRASADRVAKRLGRWFEEWAGAHLFVHRPGHAEGAPTHGSGAEPDPAKTIAGRYVRRGWL
jgi:hypothetical protein